MIPRSAWLAAGIVGATLALTGPDGQAVGEGRAVAGATLLAGAGLAAACAAAATGRSSLAVRAVAIAAGILAVVFRLALAGGPTAAPPLPTGSGPWAATVVAVSAPLRGEQRLTVRLDTAGTPRIAVGAPRFPPVVPGDQVRVSGTLEPPPDSEYGAYLVRSGVTGILRSPDLALLPAETGPGRALELARRTVDAGLSRALPEPAAGLASGILVGLRERVDRDLAADFTATGLSHVLAISGWNIALVGGLTAALLARRRARVRLAATLAVIVGYTLFAGASASVVRAAAMAGVALVALAGGRPGTAAAALGLAVAGIVLVTPSACIDPGFQLSAAATAGLLAWAEPIDRRLRDAVPVLPGWVAEGLGVSLAAQAATLPIVLLEFGRLAPLSPLLNLVVVPLVPAAMATGAAAAAAGVLAGAGGPAMLPTLVGLPAAVVLGALAAVIGLAANLPLSGLALEPPLDGIAAGLTAGLLAVVAFRGRVARTAEAVAARAVAMGRQRSPASARQTGHTGSPRHAPRGSTQAPPARPPRSANRPAGGRRAASRLTRLALATVAVAAGLVIVAAATRPDGRVHVVVLDVGQGDAILVETGHGGRVLVDGGPDPERLLVALDQRVPPWDRRLDLVVLTHPHEDHVAGLALLVDRYGIDQVLDTGARGTGPGFAAWQAALARRGTPTGRLLAGGRFDLDGVRFEALWPDPAAVPPAPTDDGSALNDASIVLLGTTGGRRFLLAGDAEAAAESVITGRGLPPVDLLKVGHHGSAGSSTAALLDAVRPRVAAISVAARNDYGHPAAATLAALAERGAVVCRTDRQGTIDVAFGPDRVSVHVDRDAAGMGPGAAAATPAGRAGTIRAVAPGARPQRGGTRGAAVVARHPVPAPARGVRRRPDVTRARAGDTCERPTGRGRAGRRRAGRRRRLAYHREHADPRPRRGGRAPPLAPAAPLAPRPLAGRRRGRGLAGAARRRSVGRPGRDRSLPRRCGRPAPRRGQAAARRRSRPRAGPRGGFRRVAGAPRLRRARPGGGGTPGDPPPRPRGRRDLARLRSARGTGRGLRGQARRAAPRADGGPLHLLAVALPRRARHAGRWRLGRGRGGSGP